MLTIRDLLRLGSDATEALISNLNDKNPHVRHVCVTALGILGAEGSGGTLLKLITGDPDPVVRGQVAGTEVFRGVSGKSNGWSLTAGGAPESAPAVASTAKATSATLGAPDTAVPVAPSAPQRSVSSLVAAKEMRKSAPDLNFNNLTNHYIALYGADVVGKPGFVSEYARANKCREFRAVERNEFEFGAFLKEVEKSMQGLDSTKTAGPFRLKLNAKFTDYDFKSGGFKFAPLAGKFNFSSRSCGYSKEAAYFPKNFVGTFLEPNLIRTLPMEESKAKAFLNERKNNRNTRHRVRDVMLDLLVRPHKIPRVKQKQYGNATVQLEVLDIIVHDSEKMEKVVYFFGQSQLAEMKHQAVLVAEKARREKEARATAEEERRRLAKLTYQREQEARLKLEEERNRLVLLNRQIESDYQVLKTATLPTRVGYMLDGKPGLSHTRNAITAALISDALVKVKIMVQPDEDGDSNVPTKWPGRIHLNLMSGLPELKSEQWYVVLGSLTVDDPEALDGSTLAMASVEVEEVIECRREGCEEANDVTALIQNRYPDVDWTPSN